MTNLKSPEYIFDKYANQYQEKYMNVDAYSHGLDLFCEVIKKQQAKVLEIACGPGNLTQYILKKRTDLQILGIDIASNMIELAKLNVPLAKFKVLDCRDILNLQQKFDAIVCGFCLPYLDKNESLQLFQDMAQSLHSNGMLYISTIQDDYVKSAPQGPSNGEGDAMQMYYYQIEDLSKMLKASGFKIVNKQQIQQNEVTDLIIMAQKID